MVKGNPRGSGYVRDTHDFYVEDEPCVRSLFEAVPDLRRGYPHDPCCGGGTIPRVAASFGISMTGSDLIDRCAGRYPVRDFLTDTMRYSSIVTNPPYSHAEDVVRHALRLVIDGGRIAVIVQEKFLYSQKRRALFAMPECEKILVLSKRPSMPTGKMLAELGEACRGGGAVNYFWAIWRVGKTTPGTTIDWLP